MFDEFFLDHPTLADLLPRLSGAANVRRLVRANAARGVDHIKILATERGGTPRPIRVGRGAMKNCPQS